MAINKKVNTAFNATGNILKKFNLMTRASARFGRSADKSFRMANRRASRFNKITSGFLKAQVIGKGVGLLTQGLRNITTGFIAFDKAALGAAVRFKDIGPDAANFNEQLKLIRASARQAGASTEFTAAQAAEGLNFMAKAGWKSTEAIAGLASMINLATSTGEDFARVADISSDLMGSFGLNADNTADKIANLNRLNDVLVKTSNSANVTVEDMFETMTQVGPVAAGVLGASLEEVAALTGVLGNSGIKASKAMTALKNVYLRLAAPTSEASKTLRRYNITMKDGQGGVRKMTDVIAELGTKIKDIDPVEQAKILDQLFGKRAIAGGKNLMNNVKNIKELEKALLNAGGTSRKTAEIMRTSIDAKLKALGSAATEAGFKILTAFEVNGKNGIDALTEAIRTTDMQPFIESLKIIAGTIGTIATGAIETARGLGLIAAKLSLFEVEVGTDVFDRAEQTKLFQKGSASRFAQAFGGTLTGGGGDQPAPEQRKAPNESEAKASAFHKSTFQGRLEIAGAREGSTLTTTGDFPGFETALLGQN